MAALRMLFDWLAVGYALDSNPAQRGGTASLDEYAKVRI
jgi:hypothetical protein